MHTAETPCHQEKQDCPLPLHPQGNHQHEVSRKLLDLKIWCFQHCSPWGLDSPDLIPVPQS